MASNLDSQELIKELKNSALYAMSLGSKELFHTNFWAWLLEQDDGFLKVFFPSANLQRPLAVFREQGNRDLTIRSREGLDALVVENKLKSLPREEQLKGYAEELGDNPKKVHFGGGLLVSVVPPSFNLPQGWSYLPFGQVIDRIASFVLESKLSSEDKALTLRYCAESKTLCDLLAAYDVNLGPKMPTWEEVLPLEEIRLSDIVHKFKADQLAQYLQKEPWYSLYQQEARKWGYELYCWPGFSDKRGIVDIRFEKLLSENPKMNIAIGVQIQGDQYRRIAQRCGQQADLTQKVFDEFKEKGWFLTPDLEHKTWKDQQTSMSKTFGKYDGRPDYPYRFVYQYHFLQDYSFAAIAAEVESDLKLSLSILQRISDNL